MASNPKKLEPYIAAHKKKQELKDNDMWQLGLYVSRAVTVAVDHCLNGEKAKSEYYKQPILQEMAKYKAKTQEEIDNEEIQKMLLAEEMWQIQARERGLPETIIKK